MSSTKYEKHVTNLVQKLQKSFGLSHWSIYVRINRHDGNDGYTKANAQYMTALIDIAPDMDDGRLTHVIYHEMAHVLISEMIAPLVLYADAKSDLYLGKLIDYHEERICEMIARNLRVA